MKYAHRVAWEETRGPIPAGMFVCHRCDNPACVRVEHLFLGTHADNMADQMAKGRQARGIQNPKAKLNETQVIEIRRSVATLADLAACFGITESVARKARSGKTWGHIP